MTSSHCLYISIDSISTYCHCPQRTILEALWPIMQGCSYLWSVKARPVWDDVCLCHTVKYAYMGMGIVVTVHLWYILHTVSFMLQRHWSSALCTVDFFTFTPHWYLCHFILSSALVLRIQYLFFIEAILCKPSNLLLTDLAAHIMYSILFPLYLVSHCVQQRV